MTEKGYISDLYKQIEEVMNKCDRLSQEIKTVKIHTINEMNEKFEVERKNYEEKIHSLENRVIELETENTQLKQENEKLRNEVDRLKKQINNNSDNSSKPPSSDIKPNIPNNRVKSNKKVGGQFGHKAHYISKKDVESKINNKEFKHQVIDMGVKSDKYISKYVVDIEVLVIAKEYRFYLDENGKYNIPKEYKVDVQYGNELKTLCSVLNTEGIVAIDRLTDFVSSISHGKLNISNGTIVNFISTLAKKCSSIISNIRTCILNSELMHTDATTARCDNKNISVRNYSTNKYTLLVATKGKGRKYIEDTNILPQFLGDMIHDHETLMYRYGRKHGECNIHITRYLGGCDENTENSWACNMISFLNSLNNYKKELKEKEISNVEDTRLERYSKRYDEILELGFKQNKLIKSKYYKKEELKLLNRLQKYKENHLLFIYDFNIPFDNNLSERDLRHVKSKQKISGYFKSMEGIQNYLDIKSIIGTCKKQGINFYDVLFKIFNNTPVTL